MTETTRLILTAVLVVFLASSGVAVAQPPSIDLQVGHAWTSATLDPFSSEPTGSVPLSASLEQFAAGDRLRLSYEFGRDSGRAAGDWSVVQHDAGATWQATLGSASWFTGTLVTRRLNGTAWPVAGVTNAAFFSNLVVHPAAATTLRTGYRLDTRRFDDVPALAQTEMGVFVSTLKNFESRTSLIVEERIGWKQDADSAIASPSAAGTGLTVSHGRGVRVMQTTAPSGATVAMSDGAGARVASALVRLAQSLDDRTGVFGEVSLRRVLRDATMPWVDFPPLLSGDPFFDDPFASDDTTFRIGARHAFARGDVLAGEASWARKSYASVEVVDGVGTPVTGLLRRDRLLRASASWAHPVMSAHGVRVDAIADYA